MRGVILRTKSRYIQQGEHMTKYFFGLEKHMAKSKNMSSVFNEKGQLTHRQQDVMQVQAKFYQSLYTKDNNVSADIKGEL